MTSKPGYSVNSDGNIVITMTPQDYDFLMMALGIATGKSFSRISKGAKVLEVVSKMETDLELANSIVELVNRINKGNLSFVPYLTERRK